MIAILLSNITNAQWEWQNPKPQGANLSNLQFTDSVTGYALKGLEIYKTVNGGNTWTTIPVGTSNNLSSLYFINSNIGFVVGEKGSILKTTNGGNTWTLQNTSTLYNLSSVCFPTIDTGYAVGSGYFLKTTNGGNTWTSTNLGAQFTKVCFTSAKIGYIVQAGTTPGYIKTTDGGTTWGAVEFSTISINAFFFINKNIGFISASYINNKTFYRTTNGGTNWTYNNVAQIFTQIYFTDSLTGFGITGNAILKTTDGGITWTNQTLPSPINTLSSVYFINSNKGFAIGVSGCMLQTNDGGTNWMSKNYGNTSGLNAVIFPNSNTGYAVGNSGTILKTTDGGNSWNTLANTLTNHYNAVFFLAADTGFVVGYNGAILKTTNGGINWTLIPSGTTQTLNSICFIDASNGYIVGDYGTILKTSNGGATWTAQNSGTYNPLYCVYVNNNHTTYICGYARIFKRQAGDTVWSDITGGISTTMKSIYFVNSTTGFIVSLNNFYKTTNGGTTWTSQTINTSLALSSVFFVNANIGYIVGNNSTIIKTVNGGNTWTGEENSVYPGVLKSVYFTDTVTGYVVGANGTILKTTHGGVLPATNNGPHCTGGILQLHTPIGWNVGLPSNTISYSWTGPNGFTSNLQNPTVSNNATTAMSGMYYLSCTINGIANPIVSTKVIVDNNIGAAAAISGSSIVVAGQTNIVYTTPIIPTASSYVWTLPNGSSGISDSNTIYVNFSDSAQSGLIKVNGVNGCGIGSTSTMTVTVAAYVPASAGAISGPATVCKGQTAITYTVPPINYATSYIWTLPNGVSGTSNTNSITVNIGTNAISGNIIVKGHNTSGNGDSSIFAITVNLLPSYTGTITGLTTVCQGQNAVIYTVPAIANATSYIWTLPFSATGISTTNSITVNFGANAVAGNITVKGHNACGNGDSAILAINVNPLPLNASAISGLATVCQGQNNVTYTVPIIANATSYIWTLPNGANGTSSTNSITVDYGTSAVSGNITVEGSNTCGNGVSSTLPIIVSGIPANAGTISGNTTVCQNQNAIIYTVPAIANATSYIWTLPIGVTGTSDSNNITVNFGVNAVSGNITVKGHSICGDGTTATIAITVNPLPLNAGAISGLTTVCQGQNSVSYTVPSITNATSYIWTLPNGTTGTSSTNSITVDFGTSAVSGNIIVKGYNSCGDGASSSFAVIVNPLLVNTAAISGISSIIAGQQNVQYSVPAIPGATSYIWTLPSGATGISSTNSIIVNYSSSAISGNITVKGTNSCGDGASSSLYVTVNPFVPNCSAQFALVADTNVLHHYFIVNNASGIQPLHYNWSWGDGTHDTIAYPSHTYNTTGYYNICLTIIDSVGCTNTYCDSSYLQKSPNAIISVTVVPQGSVGIVKNEISDKIKIYPNPAIDKLIIDLPQLKNLQNTTISIYDMQGKLLLQQAITKQQTEFNIAQFARGIYVVKVYNDSNAFISKFVKE